MYIAAYTHSKFKVEHEGVIIKAYCKKTIQIFRDRFSEVPEAVGEKLLCSHHPFQADNRL